MISTGYDIVIVDPPRKGLDDEVIDALLKYYPTKNGNKNSDKNRNGNNEEYKDCNNRRLIYVSCGFKAFKRDAARLTGDFRNQMYMYTYRDI